MAGEAKEDDIEIKEVRMRGRPKMPLGAKRHEGKIHDSRNLAMVSGCWLQLETGLPTLEYSLRSRDRQGEAYRIKASWARWAPKPMAISNLNEEKKVGPAPLPSHPAVLHSSSI